MLRLVTRNLLLFIRIRRWASSPTAEIRQIDVNAWTASNSGGSLDYRLFKRLPPAVDSNWLFARRHFEKLMKQAIRGYRNDEEGHWVAELRCGHNQHVRHDPPWQVREWTQTEEGRNAMLGVELNCVKCDEGLPPDRMVAGVSSSAD